MLFNSFKSVIQFYLKSCTINYWFHQIHRGRTVLLSKEQIGKCESLFLTAEILRLAKSTLERQILKEGKKDEYLINFPPSLHQSTICFCVIWNLQKIGKNSTRASQIDLTQIHELLAFRLFALLLFLLLASSLSSLRVFQPLEGCWKLLLLYLWTLQYIFPKRNDTLLQQNNWKNQDYCYNIQYFTPKYFSVSFLRAVIFSYDRTVIKIGNVVIIVSITEAMVHVPTCRWIQRCSP